MSLTDLVTPPFLVAAALLTLGGVVKAVRPEPAVRALHDAGLPSGRWTVRLMSVAEIGVGAGSLIAPGLILDASLAAMYLLFAAFLLRLMRAGPSVGSCGCVGSRATPPSVVHVALDLVATASGVLSSVAGVPGITHVAPGGPLPGVTMALGLAGCAFAAYACVVYLPEAWASYRRHASHGAASSSGPQVFTLSAGARP